jgi:hypothetical protein
MLKILSTKTLTKRGESMKPENWRQRAENMYFNEGKTIVQIKNAINVSTVSISKYFNSLPKYKLEKKRRIAENKTHRKEYSKEHKRTSRAKSRFDIVCGETLRREHATAVRILSKERFFNA